MSEPAIRIAMWSGPRNISTAMMRAFENRPDTVVVDEPFYAAYLAETGLDHPMREEVLAAQPTRREDVIAALSATLPEGRRIQYQKHMTQHMIATAGNGGNWLDDAWLDRLRNAFLIRAPEAVLASYSAKRADVTLADIGFVEQARIFDRVVERTGRIPPVVLGRDVLAGPHGMMKKLCAALGIPFREEMLKWPAGRRDSDGVWAPHWYAAVEASTGFADPRPEAGYDDLDDRLKPIADAARPHFERLAAHRLTP